MNDKTPRVSFFNFPSQDQLPEAALSLKMINTYNAIPPQPSLENIDLPLAASPEPDSLGERISHVNTAANSSKKRKIGCTCKKTFCLKMYCECFSQGKQCGDDCACVSCKNLPGCEEIIMNAKQGIKQGGSRSCKLSEKRCNCKKSHCLKRYCECFNAGVGCSEGCRCEGCENRQIDKKKEESPEQQSQQKEEIIQVQFPSITVFRSNDDLDKYYS